MRLQIVPACESTENAPLFVWRLWRNGRCEAMGAAMSEQEAKQKADVALVEYRQTHRAAWLESVWEMPDDD